MLWAPVIALTRISSPAPSLAVTLRVIALLGITSSASPPVPYPCGRITAPEMRGKVTRTENTIERWNITAHDEDDAHDEALDITEPPPPPTTSAAPAKIVPITKNDTRVVGGYDSVKGQLPWQVWAAPMCPHQSLPLAPSASTLTSHHAETCLRGCFTMRSPIS